jgi:hypothetical protein
MTLNDQMDTYGTTARTWVTYRLHIGGNDTGISIHTDYHWPALFRIRWPDGRVSQPGNLTRAKEAAIRYARADLAFGWASTHRWDRSVARSEGGTAAKREPEAVH